MDKIESTTYLIDKYNITKIWSQTNYAGIKSEGSIVVEVLNLAMTSNNITYAALGEQFRYWNFFPHDDGGILPAWGLAKVIDSSVDQIQAGEMLYGYLPLACHLILYPKEITDFGFKDGVNHRKELPAAYNYYERLTSNQLEDEKYINFYSLFQPLFATSFLLEIYYQDNHYFEVEDVYITSASSKTAIAFAFLLKEKNPGIKVIGITSGKNIPFCARLGCFDQVKGYDEISKLNSRASIIADFAGNSKLLSELQQVLLSSIRKCNTIGLSHWDQRSGSVSFPIENELFFAPFHAKRKQEEWGGKSFKMKLDKELSSFILWVKNWMELRMIDNKDIINVYQEVARGTIDPKEGIILHLNK